MPVMNGFLGFCEYASIGEGGYNGVAKQSHEHGLLEDSEQSPMLDVEYLFRILNLFPPPQKTKKNPKKQPKR